MSPKICPETNLDEAMKNTPINRSLENTLTRKSQDDRSMIVRDYDMDGYKKEDTVSITICGREDFPDGGLRAWLVVAGVGGNSAYLEMKYANTTTMIGHIYYLLYVS
jgi:hypothetical protein